jgi:hypothetical protein
VRPAAAAYTGLHERTAAVCATLKCECQTLNNHTVPAISLCSFCICAQAAAAVRFAAATALAAFLSSPAGPPPADVLLAAVAASTPSAQQAQQAQQQQQPGKQRSKGVLLLPLLAQLLEEDWYADVRHTGCFIMQQLLQQVRALVVATCC